MRRARDRHREAGVTLVESTFSLLILSILAIGVFSYLLDAQGTFTNQVQSSRIRTAEIDSFEAFETELSQASLSTLVVDRTNAISDTITFQLPLMVVGDSVLLGATRVGALSTDEAEAGLREVLNGTITMRAVLQANGSAALIREVFDEDDALLESVVLCRQLDSSAAQNGEKILSIVRQSTFLTVDLRFGVGRTAEEGHRAAGRFERTKSSFFRVRNL